MSHLPSLAFIIEQVATDQQEQNIKPKLNLNRDENSQLVSSRKLPFNWKLDGFKNENAPIILLGYKNRKWKNCNNFATITRTAEKDIYIINLVISSCILLLFSNISFRQFYSIELFLFVVGQSQILKENWIN